MLKAQRDAAAARAANRRPRTITKKPRGPARRSGRLQGSAPAFGALNEEALAGKFFLGADDRRRTSAEFLAALEAGGLQLSQYDDVRGEGNEALMAKYEAARCSGKGRGTFYDSKAGVTCHFCRQKKLCGEDDCPRCAHRDVDAPCIGKSECSRCHGATGRFCRQCLLLRYGLHLEDVRAAVESGKGWLCPHCYEDEHPDEAWICNSSICMKRRGMVPTGIIIHEANRRGFLSAAHMVQAQLLQHRARGSKKSEAKAPAATASASEATEEVSGHTRENVRDEAPGATPRGGKGGTAAAKRVKRATPSASQGVPRTPPQKRQARGVPATETAVSAVRRNSPRPGRASFGGASGAGGRETSPCAFSPPRTTHVRDRRAVRA
ncbi:unnamed protein product [Pedinophyceae sp. YPF-701]|nr:unnamed protein product [Pedinophyceae sp. YPF-701]